MLKGLKIVNIKCQHGMVYNTYTPSVHKENFTLAISSSSLDSYTKSELAQLLILKEIFEKNLIVNSNAHGKTHVYISVETVQFIKDHEQSIINKFDETLTESEVNYYVKNLVNSFHLGGTFRGETLIEKLTKSIHPQVISIIQQNRLSEVVTTAITQKNKVL